MNIDITSDNQYIVVSSNYPQELTYVKNELTREVANAWLLKKTQPHINVQRCFINEYGMIPVGLWLYLLQVCKKNHINVDMSDAFIKYVNGFALDYEEFVGYVNETFEGAETEDGKPFRPYDYQIKAAYTLLKYRTCCGEIATSAGKTLISFIIFKYLVDKCNVKKILYIVPSVDLATQSAAKYDEYEGYLKVHHHNWEIGILKSGLKKDEAEKVYSCNILFGTYQSLCKKSLEFFSPFNATITDECHHIGASVSFKKILNKCVNNVFSIAVTGTFPKENTIENLTIQSYVGPVVYNLSADSLINEEKSATPIYVVFEYLNWASDEDKRDLWMNRCLKMDSNYQNDMTLGTKLLKHEQEFVNESQKRIKYIGDLAIKMAHNTLILFGDIKGGYGKKLQEYIKDNSEKNAYYVDGNIPEKNRDYYKECCENDTEGKTILVASIGTFGEGIDLKNIWSIFLVNTCKSERLVRQICGRGLRKYPGKDKTVIYDFVDDLRYTENKKYYENYMWKHYLERRKIYNEQNFKYVSQNINLREGLFK